MNRGEKIARLVGVFFGLIACLLRAFFHLNTEAMQGLMLLGVLFGSLAYYAYSRRLQFQLWEVEAELHQLRNSPS